MIANLGMYDLPHLQSSNDAFWAAIRAELGFGPETLSRDNDMWDIWQNPDLLFAQTCGYPYRAKLHDKVQLVGTPDYGLPGCPAGHYCSVIVAHWKNSKVLADYDGKRFAYNEPLSQSGWAAPAHHFAQTGLTPGELVQSGAHANSAQMVAAKEADFAALDVLTYALIVEHIPDLAAQLQVIARTAPTPVLPYITSLTQDADAIAAAVERAIARLDPDHRRALRLKGLVHIPAVEYLAIPTPAPPK